MTAEQAEKAHQQEKEQKKLAGRWLKGIAKEAKHWVLLTVGIGLLNGLLLILQMYWLAYIAYGAYMHGMNTADLIYNFVGIGGIFIVRAGLAWLKEVVGFQTSAIVRKKLRRDLLSHINQMGPVTAGKLPTGQLVSTVVEQVEGVHNFLVYYLPQISLAVYVPIAILIFIFPVSLVSGFVFIICAPLIPLFMALVGMGAASLQQKNFQSMARMSSHFLDVIQGLSTLKLFGQGEKQAETIFKISDNYRMKTMSVLRIAFLSSAVLEVFAAASIALIAIYLGLGFLNHGTDNNMWWSLSGMTLQGALFILLLAPEFFLPLRELGTHYHAKAEAVGAALEIQKVLALGAEEETTEKKAAWKDEGSIALNFKNVSVDYERGIIKALNGIDLFICAGEKIAIVGPSGAGKTTLLNTLTGFVKSCSGEILVNDKDITNFTTQSWYQSVSWLGQNPTLFKGTIRDNLLLAKPTATQAECLAALEQAALLSFVDKLPAGLETVIGEQNMGLSGGQAQRLALARIYLRNTPLLLLDEPTSSLDADYEAGVLSNLMAFWQDKTVVMLTHRLSILEKMDRVVVLDKGKIVQIGHFSELMQDQNGLMFELFHANAHSKNSKGEM
ncbi:thiol reductant ABC exporter subunit CydD [Francisellaceae bacterium]|nr:thiol reductant ABC exporter subunit CydD [Francisellaceae bacterium]